MSWGVNGAVTRAFSDWEAIDRDQRVFLTSGLKFARDAHNEAWEAAGREPMDGSGRDQVDAYEDRVGGLWQSDFEWMHLAGVVRDAVTSFEVYLEKAIVEVLAAHGLTPTRSLYWGDLRTHFAKISVEIGTPQVRRIRDLRHFLTHQRGEFRTKEQRDAFDVEQDGIPAIVVQLTEESVVEIMDELAAVARQVDAAAWQHSWGGTRSQAIFDLVPE